MTTVPDVSWFLVIVNSSVMICFGDLLCEPDGVLDLFRDDVVASPTFENLSYAKER
jgi:hypothetical protein